jgi:hypothetical protein
MIVLNKYNIQDVIDDVESHLVAECGVNPKDLPNMSAKDKLNAYLKTYNNITADEIEYAIVGITKKSFSLL